MRALHVLSAIGYFIGVGLVLVAPHPTAPVASIFSETGTTLLYAGFFVMAPACVSVEVFRIAKPLPPSRKSLLPFRRCS